ncbi:bifunctional metallophosphatase/5'-nucleotidase [Paenibacillus oenotherae]|uniref:Bifunctional metallophosphatase/5'-nucleotidase n=1 Tax=Paenibacillus oenotherae TaxID=1435645 RepID=A0ABS7DBC1_9BACL|nr:bifunctional metallophosphatase/5'-nucleotidase [Paenibacillus oenotherae]MBW7477243.1 bifunctional metallophosphatase/5'-nucleotidase [Paenibacillus oenotherae]
MEDREAAAFIVDILATSDIHGHLYPTDYRTHEDRNMGLAKAATLIRRERLRSPELLLIDNGDLIQGSPLSYYYALQLGEQAHPAVAVLNELQYDAAVLGNHEFNYGLDVLRKVTGDSSFPWLSAGITDRASQEPAFGKPYIVRTFRNGIKVAILGVTTHYIPSWENPLHITGLDFSDALETVKAWARRIREDEKPDLLVVSYHGGFERNLATGAPEGKGTSENQAYAMCMEVEGLDVLITGHQHRALAAEVNGVTIIQPSCNGQAVGKISVSFTEVEGRWTISAKKAELLGVDNTVVPDEAVLKLTQGIESETQAWLDQQIGEVIGDMSISSPLECRRADHPFIAFINKVQMDTAGVQLSATALLNHESGGFGSIITMRDILTNFMYPNTLTVLRLSGQDIVEALEQTASYFQVEADGGLGVNPAYVEPKLQHYNYDMWAGIEYDLNVARPIGERVVKLSHKGQPVLPDQHYDVVLNSYRAAGGGDYDMYKGKPIIQEIDIDMSELVADYIIQRGTIHAAASNHWRVIIDMGNR